jgi:O-antigen/teichoic acid export membrane protein
MFAQLSVGFIVLNILTVVIGVSIRDKDAQHTTIRSLNLIAQMAAIGIAIVGVGILIFNKESLSLSSNLSAIFLGVGLVANVPFTIVIGRLQSSERFITSGAISLFSVIAKLVFAIIAAKLGLGTPGVIAGIGLGLIVAWILGELLLGTRTSISFKFSPTPFRHHLHKLSFLRTQAFTALLAITILTVLSSADSIVSRIALTHYQAGLYAAIATIAKTLLALATPIMWLALPSAVAGEKNKIKRYLIITAVLCITTGLIIVLAPNFFTTILIGINPGNYLHLLPIATLSMAIYALAFLIVSVNICMHHLPLVISGVLLSVCAYALVFLVSMPIYGALQASLYAQVASGATILIANLPPYVPRIRRVQ